MTHERILSPTERLEALLSTAGGFSGDGDNPPAAANMTGANEYTYVCPANAEALVYQMHVVITDTGNVDVTKYGTAALTNGVLVTVKDTDDSVLRYLAPKPLLALIDWYLISDSPEVEATLTTVQFVLRFGRVGGPIRLKAGQYVSIEFQDAPSGIEAQYVQVRGRLNHLST